MKNLDNSHLLLTDNIKNYIRDYLEIIKNNNNKFSTIIKFSFYIELCKFIEIINNFDITNKYNILKNNILSILITDDIYTNKIKKLEEFILSIDFIKDIDNSILKILLDIKNNISTFINYNKKECEKEVINIINKYINYKNSLIICNNIKKKILNNEKDIELFYNFFNSIEYNENIYDNKIIKNTSLSSIFTLKKNNNNINFLDIFNKRDITIIITNEEIDKIKNIQNEIINIENENIKKTSQEITKILIEKFNIELKNNEIYITEIDNIIKENIGGAFINTIADTSSDYIVNNIVRNFLQNILDNVINNVKKINIFSYMFNTIDTINSSFTNINSFTQFFGFEINLKFLKSIGIHIITGRVYELFVNIIFVYINRFIYNIIGGMLSFIFNIPSNIIKSIFSGGKNNCSNNNFYIIKNFKNHIKEKLFKFTKDNNDFIQPNDIKTYDKNITTPYLFVFDNKFDILSKTNLSKNNLSKISNIQNMANKLKNISNIQNIENSPNVLQILKESLLNNINNQFGGYTKNYINIENTTIRIKHYYEIIPLLEKILIRLKDNEIYLKKIEIEKIKENIDLLKKLQNKLYIYSQKIINFIENDIKNDIDNKNNILKNDYIDKYKKLLLKCDKIANKLNTVFINLINIKNNNI